MGLKKKNSAALAAQQKMKEDEKQREGRFGGRSGKSYEHIEGPFNPLVHDPLPSMTRVKNYITDNVFKRLTNEHMNPLPRKHHQHHSRRYSEGDETPKVESIVEEKLTSQERRDRIRKFLWHQNLCEERRRLEIKGIATKLYIFYRKKLD